MSVSYDIRNLKNAKDLENKKQEFFSLLKLQQKLNKDYEDALMGRASNIELGITPVAPAKKSIEEMKADKTMQFQIADKNLRTIMLADEARKVLTSFTDNEIFDLNSNFKGIEKKLEGKSNLTATFMRTFIRRYLATLKRTPGETGLDLTSRELLQEIQRIASGITGINPLTGNPYTLQEAVQQLSDEYAIDSAEILRELALQRGVQGFPKKPSASYMQKFNDAKIRLEALQQAIEDKFIEKEQQAKDIEDALEQERLEKSRKKYQQLAKLVQNKIDAAKKIQDFKKQMDAIKAAKNQLQKLKEEKEIKEFLDNLSIESLFGNIEDELDAAMAAPPPPLTPPISPTSVSTETKTVAGPGAVAGPVGETDEQILLRLGLLPATTIPQLMEHIKKNIPLENINPQLKKQDGNLKTKLRKSVLQQIIIDFEKQKTPATPVLGGPEVAPAKGAEEGAVEAKKTPPPTPSFDMDAQDLANAVEQSKKDITYNEFIADPNNQALIFKLRGNEEMYNYLMFLFRVMFTYEFPARAEFLQKFTEEYNTPPGGGGPTIGSGIKNYGNTKIVKPRGRKRIIGMGIEKNAITYVKFGRYMLYIPPLRRNILHLKFPSFVNIATLPKIEISDDLKEFILDMIDNQKMNRRLYDRLNTKDRELFNKIAARAKIDDTLQISDEVGKQEKEELKRFELVRGIVMAGQNSPEVLNELRDFLIKFSKEGKLNPHQVNEIMGELLCC